jgi:hypothetical protein
MNCDYNNRRWGRPSGHCRVELPATTNRHRASAGLLGLMLLWLLCAAQSAQAFYNPTTGRWLNRDPLGDAAFFVLHSQGKPRTERAQLRAEALKPLYAFIYNDPADRFDYLGLHCGITVHRAPFKVGVVFEWTEEPSLEIDAGHEWIEFDGQGYGYWPEGSALYSDGKIHAGDDPYTGNRDGTNWDVACNKTSGGRFGDSHTTISAGSGKGKKCDCASCDDIKNCLKAVASEWSSGTSYCLPGQNCRNFVATALLRCGLHRTAQAK